MVMEAGPGEISLVPGLLKRVDGLIALCQEVPVHQYECKLLAQHMTGLLPFLQEMKTSRTQISSLAHDTFKGLMFALFRAEKAVEKINHSSKFKRMFLRAQLAEELSRATKDILGWVNALPLVQFKISAEKEEEIRELKSKLERLGEAIRDAGSNKDEDIAAEVTEVLRAHSNGEATTSAGGGRGLDDLLRWLASRFDSDVETVRREWQEMKDETSLLREQIEYTAENKKNMEEDFLRQVMVFIEKEPVQTTGSLGDTSSSTSRERSPPPEFQCPICMELMGDPAVCASGHTFCKKCITKWYSTRPPGTETCPVTNNRVLSRTLIDNITLRSLIRRWKEAISPSLQLLSPPEASPKPSVEVPSSSVEPVGPSRSENNTSIWSPSRQGSRSPISSPRRHSVDALISSLQSSKSIEVRSNLKQLASIAQSTSGQREIYFAEGIPAIARLLDEPNPFVVEKAASVLEAMTFEVKGENCDHLGYEEREVIWNSVSEGALDSLIRLMRDGNQITRLRAAQTVVNLLAEDEIRDEIRRRDGVVTGFFGLTNIESGVLFPSEGKSLCIKGLALLGGEKPRGSPESDQALTTALIRLAGNLTATPTSTPTASPRLVEETLMALSSLVEMAGPAVCKRLLDKNDIIFLVRLYRSSRSPTARRGHTFSQSSMLTDVGKREVLNILDDLSLAEGLPQVLVECGLSTYLLPKITDPGAAEDFVSQGIKLLWRCISSSKEKVSPVFFQIDFQMEMKGIVNILARDQILVDSKVAMLSTLVHLCKGRDGRDGDPLRESFLNTGGVAAMEILAKSSVIAVREEVAMMLRLLAEFHPGRKELRTTRATVLLMNLLGDERPECRCQAVVAVASITKPDDSEIPIESVRFEQLVDLLHPTYPSECREAATGVLSKAAKEIIGSSDGNILRKNETIRLLLDIVRHNLGADAKLMAVELLISLAVQDPTVCTSLEQEGLSVLTAFGVQRGGEFREKLVQLLCAFAQESDDSRDCVMQVGGISLLMDAVEKGKNRDEASAASVAAIALRSLVTYLPAREAAIQGGLIDKAIACILLRTCSFQLIEVLTTILQEKSVAERIIKAKGVHALVRVLTLPGVAEKSAAASALAKVMKLDKESLPVVGQEKGISLLKDLLTIQATRTNPSLHFGSRMEALDALCVATEDLDNLQLLLKEQCIEPLLSILSRESLNSEDEELVFKLLWKLSRAALHSDSSVNFMVESLSRHVLRVIHTASTSSETSVETGICIIRNISLFGPNEREAMLNEGEGVVKVLLDRISRYDGSGSTLIVHNAVIGLERFMLEEKGRSCFLEARGIPLLVRFLNVDAPGQAKSFATRILVMVASHEHPPKEVCAAIWDCKEDLLAGLKDILEYGSKSDGKSQAAILLRFLMLHGPRADVCKSIRDTGFALRLMDLKADPECRTSATDALETFTKYDKDSRSSSSISWFRLPRS